MEELLSAMFKLYQSSHLMSAVKEILFKFFASLVSCEHALQQESLLAVLDKWLKSLPKMLVQLKTCNAELTGLVLMVLAKSLMRGKCCELKELSQNLTQFVGKVLSHHSYCSYKPQLPTIYYPAHNIQYQPC